MILTFTFLHGFWPDSINSVVPGGWSIAVEMTFYALLPFLIMQFRDRGSWYLVAAVAVWLCNQMLLKALTADFLAAQEIAGGPALIKDFLYINFLNQAPFFLLGCYLYFRLNTPPSKMEWALLAGWIGLAGVLRIWHQMDGVGFLAAFMGLGALVHVCVTKNIKFKPMELLGKNSYAIYLTHFLVLHQLQAIFPHHMGLPGFLLALALTTLISHGLALQIHRWIEQKVQRYVDGITKSRPVLGRT